MFSILSAISWKLNVRPGRENPNKRKADDRRAVTREIRGLKHIGRLACGHKGDLEYTVFILQFRALPMVLADTRNLSSAVRLCEWYLNLLSSSDTATYS